MKKPRGFARLLADRSPRPDPLSEVPQALRPLLAEAEKLAHGGRFQEAEKLCTRLVARAPGLAAVWFVFGTLAYLHRQPVQAIERLKRAVDLRPDYAAAHDTLGLALRQLNRTVEAEACFRTALTLHPDFANAHNNLGNLQRDRWQLAEAETSFRRAIASDRHMVKAHYNLGATLYQQGRLTEAIAVYRDALALAPRAPVAHSNLLYLLQYDPRLDNHTWRQALDHFAGCFPPPPPRLPDPAPCERRLRVGYLGPDFRSHSCAFFLAPLLAHHDRTRVEVFCYAQVATPDAVTAHLRTLADHWFDIVGLDDAQVCALIESDGIDLLVDLAGHTATNRLGVFARRPASLQVSWLGFPASTGLATIDYRLSDPWLTPADTGEYFSERLWNLDRPAHCYEPPAAPEVTQPPCLTAGHITFGSFNNLAKLSPPTLDLWAQVLTAVPGSRLLIKGIQARDPQVGERLLSELVARGVAGERVEVLGWLSDPDAHLKLYSRIDIALDTWPYNGATTTLEALWMGVPVVSLVGERAAGRYGLAFLSCLGLDPLVATDPQGFVAAAVALAADPAALAATRAGLRDRLVASPLCDGPAFARAVEAAFTAMRQHCIESRPKPG